MENEIKKEKAFPLLLQILSYVLVAAISMGIGYMIQKPPVEGSKKLTELAGIIDSCYIGEYDVTEMEDMAAAGMIAGIGDRWSYYIPASEYEAYMDTMENAYVGIGVTISAENAETGFEVLKVEPNSGALEAGILPGDILTHVEGESVLELGMEPTREKISGDEGTQVSLTFTRNGEILDLTVTRKRIQVIVASGQMLDGNIGLVTINNFDDRCAAETIAAIDTLVANGATALIFDVRNNPGGYVHELVQVLDHLLPSGILFQSVNYSGHESIERSDSDCLKLPMTVLINADSYSAAEFFAAALVEYDWAFTVGTATCGKGYFQETIPLGDGSYVNLSTGKYYTPNGVNLAEEGGLIPDILVEVSEEVAANIYADLVPPEEDPQIQAAIEALK